jgi:hypothetical protein
MFPCDDAEDESRRRFQKEPHLCRNNPIQSYLFTVFG